MEKRIIVAGSRTFDNYSLMRASLDCIIQGMDDVDKIVIVSGHAVGADQLGEDYAKLRELDLKVFPAEWEKYGRKAGPIRNSQMIEFAKEESPMVVAFWDGKSHGTMDTLAKAQIEGIPCFVVIVDSEGFLINTVEYKNNVLPVETVMVNGKRKDGLEEDND